MTETFGMLHNMFIGAETSMLGVQKDDDAIKNDSAVFDNTGNQPSSN